MVGCFVHECVTCLGPHEDEIHEATTRVREWFRRELARRLNIGPEPVTDDASLVPAAPLTPEVDEQ